VTTTDDKDYFRDEVATARQVRDGLPVGSHLRAAVTDEILNDCAQRIDNLSVEELNYAYSPPAYGFICSRGPDRIAELDSDIDLVLSHTDERQRTSVTQFLRTQSRQRSGDWYGGLFDVWAKATLLKYGSAVTLDFELPNGRNHDACLQIGGRRFHLESTVISEDDESRDVWDKYLAAKQAGYSKSLIRPGPFCPANAKGPSPYYFTLRLYAKVFDKLARGLNPDKSQCADDEPNILLVSFAGPGVRPDHPGVRWGLDELFLDHPRLRGDAPEGHTDISLEGWLDFAVNERISAGEMTVEWYCENSSRVIAAPRRLGGILLFNGCTFVSSRVNYNSKRECAISHAEMVALENLLSAPANYWF
jgi:hypothetical protein